MQTPFLKNLSIISKKSGLLSKTLSTKGVIIKNGTPIIIAIIVIICLMIKFLFLVKFKYIF